MTEALTFHELIRRVRSGDQDAATEVVRSYEPEIRRVVRFRLNDARLANLFDSMDICQSVMKSFFVRAAAGQYELETPQQLLALLARMARNKLISQARKQHTEGRDCGRVVSGGLDEGQLVAPGTCPSREVTARELVQEIRRRLTPEELRIMELKNQGHDWGAVAAALGGNANALRMKLNRALDRVAGQLGLDQEP
jgi:DNA-directed RNA polymerase specialized sigma24 family protein